MVHGSRAMQMIYISQGNIPSREANSIQIAKMSQAFASMVDRFELVTQGGLLNFRNRRAFSFSKWYGLHRPFRIRALPLKLTMRYPLPEFHRNLLFPFLAVLYARLKSPDVIYTRWSLVARLALSFGIPVLWEWHEPLKSKVFRRPPFSNGKFLGVVTISDTLGTSFVEKNGLPEEKMVVEQDGVDLKNFMPYLEKREARKKIGMPTDRPIIAYCGHLYDHKGIPVILEIAKKMRHCIFLLVGGLQEDIERRKGQCKAFGLDNFHITGFVLHDRIPNYLFASDVLLLPNSRIHPFSDTTSPLKLFEYMASKRPIVASALTNISSVLKHEKNALLAQPDNPQNFSTHISYLLDHPGVASALADRAFEQVQYYDWNERARRILRFIENRLRNTAGRGFRLKGIYSELRQVP
jgi:glycosyltransferase involved in cell wall biosynthesis